MLIHFIAYILYVILFLSTLYAWKKSLLLPEGNVFTYKYNGFKAIVVVDKQIQKDKQNLYVYNNPININKLTLACAVSMESVDKVSKTYGPKALKSKKQVKECVFYFLSPKTFSINLEKVGLGGRENTQGYAIKLKDDFFNKKTYCCVARAIHMKAVSEIGHIAIHEYIHCYSEQVSGEWDHRHNIWVYKAKNGKNIDQLATERTKNILKQKKYKK